MDTQTWVKTDEGNFVRVEHVTHVVVDTNGVATIYVQGNGYNVGRFSTAKAFFEAMQRGLSREEIDG